MDAFSNDRVSITMWLFSGMGFWSLTLLLKRISMELSSPLCCLSETQWTSSCFIFFKIQVIHLYIYIYIYTLLTSALLSEKFCVLISSFVLKFDLIYGVQLYHITASDRSQCWITAVKTCFMQEYFRVSFESTVLY